MFASCVIHSCQDAHNLSTSSYLSLFFFCCYLVLLAIILFMNHAADTCNPDHNKWKFWRYHALQRTNAKSVISFSFDYLSKTSMNIKAQNVIYRTSQKQVNRIPWVNTGHHWQMYFKLTKVPKHKAGTAEHLIMAAHLIYSNAMFAPAGNL